MIEASNILTTATPLRLQGITQSMQVVARHHGVSVMRQLVDILRLRHGPGKLSPFEYYSQHLYRRSLGWDARRSYLGERQSRLLNYSLTAPQYAGSRAVLDDKPVLLALAEASGIPVTRTQAHFSTTRQIGPWAQLGAADSIVDFLLNTACYPLFGKPSGGRKSYGGVQIERLDTDGRLVFAGDAPGPHVAAFAAEVAAKFPAGYLFQSCAKFPANLRALAPDALGPLRIVTLHDRPEGPSVLMTYLRLPVSGTETGPGRCSQRIIANIDPARGEIAGCILRGNGRTGPVEQHPVTGQTLRGFPVPQLNEAIDLALRCHRLLPLIGIIGWDIGLTEQGALLIEGNGSPGVTDFQLISGRGVLNPDFAPRYAAARARADAQSRALRLDKQAAELGAIREIVAFERGRR